MNLTNMMKDEIIQKLLEKAVPKKELEEAERRLAETLQEPGDCLKWEESKAAAREYPDQCWISQEVNLLNVFPDWRRDNLSVRLDIKYAFFDESNCYYRDPLRFSRNPKGEISNNYGFIFGNDVIKALEGIYAWAARYESTKADLQSLMSSINASTKLIEKIPETKDIIEASIEAKKRSLDEDRRRKEDSMDLEFINRVFQEGGVA